MTFEVKFSDKALAELIRRSEELPDLTEADALDMFQEKMDLWLQYCEDNDYDREEYISDAISDMMESALLF
jgi:hypothetical protein